MKIKENINPVTNPITTISGVCFIIIAIFLKVVPMFVEVNQTQEDFFIYALALVGFALIFIPDEIGNTLRNILKRKSENI